MSSPRGYRVQETLKAKKMSRPRDYCDQGAVDVKGLSALATFPPGNSRIVCRDQGVASAPRILRCGYSAAPTARRMPKPHQVSVVNLKMRDFPQGRATFVVISAVLALIFGVVNLLCPFPCLSMGFSPSFFLRFLSLILSASILWCSSPNTHSQPPCFEAVRNMSLIHPSQHNTKREDNRTKHP